MEKKIFEVLPSYKFRPVPTPSPLEVPQDGYMLTDGFIYLCDNIVKNSDYVNKNAIYQEVVYSCKDYLNIKGIVEAGSLHNNTGIKGYSDLDILLCVSASNIPNDSRIFLSDVHKVLDLG